MFDKPTSMFTVFHLYSRRLLTDAYVSTYSVGHMMNLKKRTNVSANKQNISKKEIKKLGQKSAHSIFALDFSVVNQSIVA